MEITDLPERELKIMIIKILTNVRKTMQEQSENFNKKDRKYILKLSNRNH